MAIHAGKQWTLTQRYLAAREPFYSALTPLAGQALPLGVIVALCRVVAVERMTAGLIAAVPQLERSFGDYRPGRWMWMLEDVHPLPEPIPAKGEMGLWEWWEMPEELPARLLLRWP